jgi:hypothetical protein
MELPEEARESSESMRRVIGDQIQALTELAEIISRHGKALDVSSPSLGERPVARQVETAAPAIAVGGEAYSSWGDTARTARPATTRPEPVRTAAPSRPVTPRPATAAPVTPPAPAAGAPAETGSESGGWVSDLLRRASRDEESPAGGEPMAEPARPVEAATNGAAAKVEADQPLGALSVDIAKAIDHEASIELWDRHRRGESNVFTRRLYTLQGQQTFDEIRKKYQRDAKFRAAVDRYVSDFEKLLAEVNRKNGDNRTASNAYLTSDTGKVYTMLAHASGRFD